MSMETMLRYIVGIAIAYGIGKWIYQSIRSRSIDYFLLAIIALMGAVLWLSRGFLISNRVYDFWNYKPRIFYHCFIFCFLELALLIQVWQHWPR